MTMEFRRFLAIVGMGIVFQLMWESINVGIRSMTGTIGIPYFTLYYLPSPYDEFVIWVPWSAIFLKGIVYSCGSYVTASMAGRKFIDGKIDLVKDRGHRVVEHMTVGGFASLLYTISMIVLDPILVNGNGWFLGDYEAFGISTYFGVDPLYFLGCLGSSCASYILLGLIESRIEYHPEDVLYDYSNEKQKPFRHHEAGFFVLSCGVFIPSFFALVNYPVIGAVNFLVIIPIMYVVYIVIMRWASRRDDTLVGQFCKEHPGSFVCKLK